DVGWPAVHPRMVVVVVCTGLAGCGFSAAMATGVNGNDPVDAPGTDSGSADALDGGAAATDCLARWLAGTVHLRSPPPLSHQSSRDDDERDPWISNDGLRLYYAFRRKDQDSDIYLATRSDVTASFGKGVAQVNVNTTQDEDRPALTPDEKTFVMATTRD